MRAATATRFIGGAGVWSLRLALASGQARLAVDAARRTSQPYFAGQYSADGLYNLANQYARAGKPGLAVLNYERAALLAPNDPDITSNLEYVRATAQVPTEPRTRFTRFARSTSPTTAAWLGVMGVALLGGGLLASKATRRYRALRVIAHLARHRGHRANHIQRHTTVAPTARSRHPHQPNPRPRNPRPHGRHRLRSARSGDRHNGRRARGLHTHSHPHRPHRLGRPRQPGSRSALALAALRRRPHRFFSRLRCRHRRSIPVQRHQRLHQTLIRARANPQHRRLITPFSDIGMPHVAVHVDGFA